MDHETSEEVIPQHGRQQILDDVPAELQVAYDGFEDLTDQVPWTSGEY